MVETIAASENSRTLKNAFMTPSRMIRRDKASRAAAYIRESLAATVSCIALKLFFRLKEWCHAGILIISIPDRFCKMVHFAVHRFSQAKALQEGQRRAWRRATTHVVMTKDGGHAKFTIGRAFARPPSAGGRGAIRL